MWRQSWTAYQGRKFLRNLSKHQPTSLYHGTWTAGAGPSVLTRCGFKKETTLERNHKQVTSAPWVWRWGQMPNPNYPPSHPREAETLGGGSEATRKEEVRDASKWEGMEHSMKMRKHSTNQLAEGRQLQNKTKLKTDTHARNLSVGLMVSTFSSAALRHFRFWSISLICSSISRQRLLVTVTGMAQARLWGKG